MLLILLFTQVAYMTAIQFSYESSSLPTTFSAEERWGDLLSRLQDQAGPPPTPLSL